MSEYWDLVNQLQKEYEIKIFTWIWRNRLKDAYGDDAKVIKVKGWRTALVDGSYGSRQTVTFLFRLRIGKWTKYI
jgi:hypothetical protein